MTKTQIQKCITASGEYGYDYPMDEWIDLSKITMIFLDQDGRLIITPATKRFRFNTDTSMLEIADGYLLKSGDFVGVAGLGIDGTYRPTAYYSFSVIEGFISTSQSISSSMAYRIDIPWQRVIAGDEKPNPYLK